MSSLTNLDVVSPLGVDGAAPKGGMPVFHVNRHLTSARVNKNDEFYTQLTDIEKELGHYKDHFKGKVVYCNCDDYEESNFFKYFMLNFKFLGLKRLITSHYSVGVPTYALSLELSDSGEVVVTRASFEGDGDFRNEESIDLLKLADIVVTNPPFSLFREYVSQLMEYDKKFIIIGNMGAVIYKDFFPLLKDNLVWLGVSPRSMSFLDIHGQLKTVNAVWFTNLFHAKRSEKLPLSSSYHPEKHLPYDNYDAINVDKVRDIPKDYYGVMGVPLTYFEKHNAEQFEILGLTTRGNTWGLRNKVYSKADYANEYILNATGCVSIDGLLSAKYARILIRRIP